MESTYMMTREENLVNDVCDDDQEGVAKVTQNMFFVPTSGALGCQAANEG